MVVVERESVAAASASTIWNACFRDMRWESWDEDVARMENVDAAAGLVEGATATFVMKEGSGGFQLPIRAVDVAENRAFTFRGTKAGGALGFTGTIQLEERGAGKTLIRYSFSMHGLIGGPFSWFNRKACVDGTETGLANIVRLSEEAENNRATE